MFESRETKQEKEKQSGQALRTADSFNILDMKSGIAAAESIYARITFPKRTTGGWDHNGVMATNQVTVTTPDLCRASTYSFASENAVPMGTFCSAQISSHQAMHACCS